MRPYQQPTGACACRYISEDHSGVVLHPIDILDVGTGALVDALVDPNLQLINPVNMPHPLIDVIVTGSSGHLYCWRPEVRHRARVCAVAPRDALSLHASAHIDAACCSNRIVQQRRALRSHPSCSPAARVHRPGGQTGLYEVGLLDSRAIGTSCTLHGMRRCWGQC